MLDPNSKTLVDSTNAVDFVWNAFNLGESTIIADPHIIPFEGKQFDFMGEDKKCYSMLSAGSLQVNAQMKDIGYGFTVITEMGIVVGKSDPIHFKVSMNSTEVQYIEVFQDGERIKPGATATFVTGLKDESGASIKGRVEVGHQQVSFYTGNFQITAKRCTNYRHVETRQPHLDIPMKVIGVGFLSDGVMPHGVVGQSLNPRKKTNLEGKDEDYLVSDLFAFDSKFNRYKTEPTTKKLFRAGLEKRAISCY